MAVDHLASPVRRGTAQTSTRQLWASPNSSSNDARMGTVTSGSVIGAGADGFDRNFA